MALKVCLYGGIAAVILLSAGQPALAVENAGALQGVVTEAQGKPVAGAFVRLQNADRNLTFMVVSHDGGVFAANDLPAGHYTVQAVGGDGQSKISAPIAVTAGHETKINLALADKRAPMLAPAWPDILPGHLIAKAETITLPEGAGKELILNRCNVCHDSVRIAYSRHDREAWQNIIGQMRSHMRDAKQVPLPDEDAKTIVDYLVKNYGAIPHDANSRLPTALVTGKARDYRVVTYKVKPRFSTPHDIAVDPTGVAWAGLPAGVLLRFDPRTLDIETVQGPPGSVSPEKRRVGEATITDDGILWAMDKPNARWLSYDIKAKKWQGYYMPEGSVTAGNTLVVAPDGVVWGTNLRTGAYSLNPKTGEWHDYRSKLGRVGGYGAAVAGDGSVWIAENFADRMGRIDPKTGTLEDLTIPGTGTIFPRRMDSDAEGNLWVGLWQPGQLMKIDYKTRKMTLFTSPSKDAGCYSVSVDKKNNIIWVSEQEVDKIARFDPETKSWMEFPLPYAQSDPRRIGVDPTNPNRVFFSGSDSELIGFIEYTP